MREQNLTDKEIRDLWRNRTLRDKSMILCLSQLEACEYHEMRDRVESLGLIGKGEYMNYRRNRSDEADKEYKAYNYTTFSRKVWGHDEICEVFRMRKKGFRAKEIANILGRTEGSVCSCILKHKEAFEQ